MWLRECILRFEVFLAVVPFLAEVIPFSYLLIGWNLRAQEGFQWLKMLSHQGKEKQPSREKKVEAKKKKTLDHHITDKIVSLPYTTSQSSSP